MGRLIGAIKDLDNFNQILDENLERLLGEALDKRNWLAHAYFSERATHFIHSSGRAEMIAELEETRDLFRRAEDKLNSITYALSEMYDLNENMIQEIVEKMQE